MKRFLLATASIIALSSAPAAADPISLAVSALSTGMSAAQGTLIAFGSLSGSALIGANFAVRAALGYALNALSTPPREFSRGYNRSVNQLGAAQPHQIIYGETVVGGVVFYQALTGGGNRLHRCIAFAGHEIDSYQAIYVNGDEVTLDGSGYVTETTWGTNTIRILQHTGSDTQTADSTLVSEVTEWTTAHRARGVAYLYCRFEDASNFPNGIPVISVKIRGRKVEDTRIASTAWSDNPALCLRDYLMADFGLAEDSTHINDTLTEDAADVCEETVSGADRYTCNGSFLLDAAPEDVIRNLLSAMGGTFWNYSGQWAMKAAEYNAPTVTLDEDDLRGEVSIATRHSRRDNFNSVHGVYKGAATEYQEDEYQPVGSGIYLDEDNGIPSISDLNLPFTDTEVMAQRIATTFLRRNREQITVTAAFGLKALQLKISDTVMFTLDHMSWSSKVFEVVDWRLGIADKGNLVVNMILRAMAESVFSGVVGTLTDESGNALTDESLNRLTGTAA